MNKDYPGNQSTSHIDQPGIYELIKKLSEIFADQHSKSPDTRKKFLAKSYEILLKKGTKASPEGLPSDWDDSDVLNAIKLEIFKRCKIKRTWTRDLCDRVINQMELLYENKDTDYFKNSVNPTLRMLLCIEYYQQKIPSPEKKGDRFFNTDIISSYLDNISSFLPKVDGVPLPKCHGISHSLSDGQLKYFPKNNRFDYIFQIDRHTNDLDEGFVTPNEEHIEKTPCSEPKRLPIVTETPKIKFFWDYEVVCVPPSRHKTWENYETIGKPCRQPPFIEPNNVVQFWLTKASSGVTKISREQLLDDLLVLFVGIPSSTFVRNGSSFSLQGGIYTDEHTPEALQALSQKFIQTGTGFIALTQLSESSSRSNGEEDAISLAFKLALREHLYKYQTVIISAKEKLSLKETSYFKLVTSLHPFMEEIVGLQNVLIKEQELKGVSLLEFLFQLMARTSNSAIYHTLSSLFLLPCMYYFRLLDDWIFFGKWHRDLPMSYCDMNIVKDRPTWVDACRPSSNLLWLVPTRELALCGKSISLLTLSKNYEKFQLLLESENRPKLKVCLNPEELRVLREHCIKYYDEGLQLFCEEEEEKLDPAICARDAAQKHAEEFEKKKLQNKIRDIEKKKEELILREEDLARSAHNKELQRQEEQAENERIALQYEEILCREHQKEIEKSKAILQQYKQQIELEEKRMKHAEWRAKRYVLNEKRKEFLLNEIKKELDIMPTPIKEDENAFINLEKTDKSKPTSDNIDEIIDEVNEELTSLAESNNMANMMDNYRLNAVETIRESTENGSSTHLELDSNLNAETTKADIKKKTVDEIEIKTKQRSELERNRDKVLGSDIMNDNAEHIAFVMMDNDTVNAVETICESTENGNSTHLELDSNLNSETTNADIKKEIVDEIEMKTKQRSELERNRDKVLGSDIMNDNAELMAFVMMDNDTVNAVETICESTENGNSTHLELDSNLNSETTNVDIKKETVDEIEIKTEQRSELERNRDKVLGSDIMNDNAELIAFVYKDQQERSDLQKNKTKILGSQFDNKEIYGAVMSKDEKIENLKSEDGYSDLEKNRMKILGSDLGNDRGTKLHVWDEEAQRNRKNMLDSHIPYVVEYEIEKANLLKKSEEILRKRENDILNEENSIQEGNERSITEGENKMLNKSAFKDSEKIAFDTQDCDEEKIFRDLDESVDMNYKKPDWFTGSKSYENNKIKNVFKSKSSSLILKEDIDFTYLNKLVPQSLSTVLEIQTKLVNKALLRMFLNEFELLKVAQKLREYFFLHGEFGKRLTSALSKAIESEEPSTLLTFYRLRSILAEASRGDIKEISFVVNDTPIAFDHTNPQVLLCLGLTYKFEWPLNLIFTDKAISKYNDVFIYMFALQRVSWHLDKVCHMLQFKSADLKGYQYTQIHLYRYVMSQFVNTLRSYIMTTIIENCWQEFVKDVPKVKDIDELYRRHAIYIRDINSKCFLDKRANSLMKQIEKLLHYILVFSRALFYGEWSIKENNEYTHSNFEKLRASFTFFLSKACLITKHVKKLVRINYQKELEVLDDFLTINSFYDS